ncbi:hypothetical protein BDV98DRAFT_589632 [Pterulicium gracile]|uniref:Uncharacterized protein n=1 Tax=Pterulicium gracile TaxID=1884261 RepID=A0A5C3R2F2_9AGAR|nr:hypothetical protein BDV98DRAFT_589632 [Pterula gracilis]
MISEAIENIRSESMTDYNTLCNRTRIVARYICTLFTCEPNSTLHGYLTPHADEVFTTIFVIVRTLGPDSPQALQNIIGSVAPYLVDLAKKLYPSVKGLREEARVNDVLAVFSTPTAPESFSSLDGGILTILMYKVNCKRLNALRSVWRWDVHDNVAKHLQNADPESKRGDVARAESLLEMVEQAGIDRTEVGQ